MTKATRNKAAKSATVQFNMTATAELDLTNDDLMASLMSDIDDFDPTAVIAADSDEINESEEDALYAEDDLIESASIEAAAPPVVLVDEVDPIDAAVAELEKAEKVHALYCDEDDAIVTVSEADKPATDEVNEAVAAAKKGKTKKEPKVKAAKVPKEPKAPKEPTEPRVTYVGHTTSEVLAAKLGSKKAELLLLETSDVALDEEALAAKQALILSDIDTLAKKVGEKAVMLMAWLKNGGTLNEVMARAFTVLAKDGELTSGNKGNLQVNLSEKYSPGTSASQANQMFMLFPFLAVTKREKGVMVANPDSLIFMKAKAELGLA